MKKWTTVKKGSKGTDVYVLQSALRMLQFVGSDGKPIDIDGICGDDTVRAINQFQEIQRAYGCECGTAGRNDGCFGPACWKRLLGE